MKIMNQGFTISFTHREAKCLHAFLGGIDDDTAREMINNTSIKNLSKNEEAKEETLSTIFMLWDKLDAYFDDSMPF